jgi:autonomous glycyl radical cofactor GrcA
LVDDERKRSTNTPVRAVVSVLKYLDDRRNKVVSPKRRTRAEVQKLVAEFDRTAVVVNGQHSNPEILLPNTLNHPADKDSDNCSRLTIHVTRVWAFCLRHEKSTQPETDAYPLSLLFDSNWNRCL